MNHLLLRTILWILLRRLCGILLIIIAARIHYSLLLMLHRLRRRRILLLRTSIFPIRRIITIILRLRWRRRRRIGLKLWLWRRGFKRRRVHTRPITHMSSRRRNWKARRRLLLLWRLRRNRLHRTSHMRRSHRLLWHHIMTHLIHLHHISMIIRTSLAISHRWKSWPLHHIHVYAIRRLYLRMLLLFRAASRLEERAYIGQLD